MAWSIVITDGVGLLVKSRVCCECGLSKDDACFPHVWAMVCFDCWHKRTGAMCADQKLKARARAAVRRAVVRGEVFRPNRCDQCGCLGDVFGHHRDYTRALDLVWLCRKCHEGWRLGVRGNRWYWYGKKRDMEVQSVVVKPLRVQAVAVSPR